MPWLNHCLIITLESFEKVADGSLLTKGTIKGDGLLSLGILVGFLVFFHILCGRAGGSIGIWMDYYEQG